jgi:tetratricopeptide (TPR) repeat protein
MYPVFLSVSSNDEMFARSIWQDLPRDWGYLYSVSGEEGAELWDEISRRELPSSKYFIVFWSKGYARAAGCVRELRQAAELVASGTLSPLILRLDNFPITWSGDLPSELKPVFSDLARLLDVRTSRPNIPVDDASHLVQRFIEPVMSSAHPMFPRDDILESTRSAAQKERFKCFPAMWISGFPGAGRATVVVQLNRSMTPNGRLIPIDINAASLPTQVCLKLESAGLGADIERLHQVQEAEEAALASGVAARIERIFQAGNYVVFRHEMILQNNVDLPEWFDEVVGALDPAQRPKLFIVSQMPLSIDRRKACFDKLAEQRVPGFSSHEVTPFTESLLAHFDPQPDRWTAEAVDDLIEAAQGNLGLLVTLTKAASSVIDLGEVDELVDHAKNRALQSIAYYVDWAFGTLHDDIECQRLLLFLNDVSPCDPRDLDSIFEDAGVSILNIISKCMKLGFVERDSSGLYRLTPFLSGRLARHLVRTDLVDWRRRVIESFAKSPIDFGTQDNEFIRIEARIQASLWTGNKELPVLIEKFVSASHWFQAGVRLYHARQFPAAHRLLKKAFATRESFSQASRTELLRYFGLAAIRTGQTGDIETCISLLNSDYKNKEIASYLEAFRLEVQQRYLEAKDKYEEALRLNHGMANRMERIYRPLIKCILLTKFPDFKLAEGYARDWAKVRQTVFTKHALCRIYLLWMQKESTLRQPGPADLKERYDTALSELEAHPGGMGAYHEVLAEHAELRGAADIAVAELEKAFAIDDRFELQLKRWQIMARDRGMSKTALSELEEFRTDARQAALRDAHLKTLVEIFVTAMSNGIYSAQRLNRFAVPMVSREIGVIVSRVRRRSADA